LNPKGVPISSPKAKNSQKRKNQLRLEIENGGGKGGTAFNLAGSILGGKGEALRTGGLLPPEEWSVVG